MRAIFIAVGSEMLEQNRMDTNSLYVAGKLMEKGILMDMKIVISDDLTRLSWFIKNAYKRCQLVIITGGLGPTEDDITREATADALGKELVFHESIVEKIGENFKKRGLDMPDINTRQGFVLESAEVLPNEVGTAPGQYIDEEPAKIILLPGPPHEMKPMFDKVFEDKIAPLSNFFVYKRLFKFAGITESETDARIAEMYRKYRNVRTTILANPGLIEVHLLGRSRKTPDEAETQVNELAERIKEELKDYLVTEKDITIEEYVLEELRKRGLTLSAAESCTGGGLGNALTNIPGSSDVFLGGVTAYSNDLKAKLLGVLEKTLEKKGAVAKETAVEMAHGIRNVTGADIGVSITGIAGPGGCTNGKPVGLVFMHVTSAKGETAKYRIFPGPRDVVKKRTIHFTLNLIRQHLNEYY